METILLALPVKSVALSAFALAAVITLQRHGRPRRAHAGLLAAEVRGAVRERARSPPREARRGREEPVGRHRCEEEQKVTPKCCKRGDAGAEVLAPRLVM